MIAESEPAELAQWQRDPGREAPIVVGVREPLELDYRRSENAYPLPLRRLAQASDGVPRERAMKRYWRWSVALKRPTTKLNEPFRP